MNLETFQAEQKAWTEKNFGVGPADHPLLGLFEEFGELCHAELKAAQGIRGDSAKHEVAAKDAIGDIVIYFADYATKRGVPFIEMTTATTFEDVQREHSYRLDGTPVEVLPRVGKALGKIAEAHMTKDRFSTATALWSLLREVATFCMIRGWNLDALVTETWAMVSKRDWTKNKETGAA